MSQADHLAFELSIASSPCKGDERFTASYVTRQQLADMRRLCRECPVMGLCDEFAHAEQPSSGVYAGVVYNNQGVPSRRPQHG